MDKYEFEFYSETGQTIVLMELNSNTEAEHVASRWMQEKKAEAYRQLHPRQTRSEQREILSGLAWLHVSVSRPVERSETGQIDLYDRRRSR